jgi:phosphate uptake regulator
MRLILSAQQDESVRTMIGLKSRADVAGYSIIAADLERIADQTRVIASNVAWLIESELKIPGAIQNTLRQHAADVGTLFSDAMRALLSRELEMGVEATELASRLWKGEEEIAVAAAKLVAEPEAMLRIRRILVGLVLVAESCRQIAIVAFSRHQHEGTKYLRPLDEKAPRG